MLLRSGQSIIYILRMTTTLKYLIKIHFRDWNQYLIKSSFKAGRHLIILIIAYSQNIDR